MVIHDGEAIRHVLGSFCRSSLVFFCLLRCNICSERVHGILTLRTEHLCTAIVATTVQLHELRDIKLWLLQDFHLADVHILKRENAFALLLDLLADGLGDKLLDQVTELATARLRENDVSHLLADLLDLSSLRIAIC